LRRSIRHRLNWWLAALAPGLLLRALVPVGFMPMVDPDFGIRMVVCEGYAPLPATKAANDASADMPMDMDMGAMDAPSPAHQGGAASHVGDCPYGSSPALGALPTLAMAMSQGALPAEPAVAASQVVHVDVSRRAQSPRGPPALA